jgi:hypothetical protein
LISSGAWTPLGDYIMKLLIWWRNTSEKTQRPVLPTHAKMCLLNFCKILVFLSQIICIFICKKMMTLEH